MGLPGEQGAAQLLAAVAEGAGEVEIFVAVRATERAVSWVGGGVSWGGGAGTPGARVHLWVGRMAVLTLCVLPRLGLQRGLCQGGGAERGGAPITICHRAYRHTGGCWGGAAL